MANTIEAEPPPLTITEDECKLIDSIVEHMTVRSRRSVSVEKYSRINTNYPKEAAKLDEIISDGVDKLRPVLKVDFFEKMFERTKQLAWTPQYEHDAAFCLIILRMGDSWRYVRSITKKVRGQDIVPPYSMEYAREELKKRGLWKK